MKMSPVNYRIIGVAMRAVIESLAENPDQNFAGIVSASLPPTRLAWNVYNIAMFDIKNADTHPAYTHGKRLRFAMHRPGFDPYSQEGINDSHIETAILRIMGEINAELTIKTMAHINDPDEAIASQELLRTALSDALDLLRDPAVRFFIRDSGSGRLGMAIDYDRIERNASRALKSCGQLLTRTYSPDQPYQRPARQSWAKDAGDVRP